MPNKTGKQDMWIIHTCECGKTFIPTYKYVYKIKKANGNIKYYCSYTCWRKAGGDSGHSRHYNRTKE